MSERIGNLAEGSGTHAGKALAEAEQRLRSRRQELSLRVQNVQRDLEHQNAAVSANGNERAAERANDEVLEAIGGADARELADIRSALRRLELGTYGVCTLCGRVIAAARLRALPQAEYCERCASIHDTRHRAAR